MLYSCKIHVNSLQLAKRWKQTEDNKCSRREGSHKQLRPSARRGRKESDSCTTSTRAAVRHLPLSASAAATVPRRRGLGRRRAEWRRRPSPSAPPPPRPPPDPAPPTPSRSHFRPPRSLRSPRSPCVLESSSCSVLVARVNSIVLLSENLRCISPTLLLFSYGSPNLSGIVLGSTFAWTLLFVWFSCSLKVYIIL